MSHLVEALVDFNFRISTRAICFDSHGYISELSTIDVCQSCTVLYQYQFQGISRPEGCCKGLLVHLPQPGSEHGSELRRFTQVQLIEPRLPSLLHSVYPDVSECSHGYPPGCRKLHGVDHASARLPHSIAADMALRKWQSPPQCKGAREGHLERFSVDAPMEVRETLFAVEVLPERHASHVAYRGIHWHFI
jgi:hypothetical protein